MKILLKGVVWDKESIQKLIDENDQAVARALMVVYNNQTTDEKQSKDTYHDNGVGFSSLDAEVLTDVAEKWKYWQRWASARQCNMVRRRVRKYWKQILQHMLEQNPEAEKVTATQVKKRVAEGQQIEWGMV